MIISKKTTTPIFYVTTVVFPRHTHIHTHTHTHTITHAHAHTHGDCYEDCVRPERTHDPEQERRVRAFRSQSTRPHFKALCQTTRCNKSNWMFVDEKQLSTRDANGYEHPNARLREADLFEGNRRKYVFPARRTHQVKFQNTLHLPVHKKPVHKTPVTIL